MRDGRRTDRDLVVLDKFRTHLRLRNLAPASIDQRFRALRRLSVFVDRKPLVELELDDLDEWWTDCLRLQPEGRACELSHVRSFYRWAVVEGVVEVDPTRRLIRPKLARRLPRPIDDDRLSVALEAAPNDRLRVILILAAFAGLRAGEIARLRVEDLAFHEDPAVLIVRKGKGSKDRVVPMADVVAHELRAFLGGRARGFVIGRLDGVPGQCPEYRVSQVANQFLHGQGIPETLHQLRHRFGTTLYRRSRDLRLVQEVLGHASPVTTAGYAAFAPEQAAAAVEGASILVRRNATNGNGTH
jgi:integrase/recombinase XerC